MFLLEAVKVVCFDTVPQLLVLLGLPNRACSRSLRLPRVFFRKDLKLKEIGLGGMQEFDSYLLWHFRMLPIDTISTISSLQ